MVRCAEQTPSLAELLTDTPDLASLIVTVGNRDLSERQVLVSYSSFKQDTVFYE